MGCGLSHDGVLLRVVREALQEAEGRRDLDGEVAEPPRQADGRAGKSGCRQCPKMPIRHQGSPFPPLAIRPATSMAFRRA